MEVCLKVEPIPGEPPKMYGRHFDYTDLLVSKVSESLEVFVSVQWNVYEGHNFYKHVFLINFTFMCDKDIITKRSELPLSRTPSRPFLLSSLQTCLS